MLNIKALRSIRIGKCVVMGKVEKNIEVAFFELFLHINEQFRL